MVDQARFELAAFRTLDLRGKPVGLQTERSAELIYWPTTNEQKMVRCFNPYALVSLRVQRQAKRERHAV